MWYSKTYLDVVEEGWKVTPVFAIMHLSCWTSTSDHRGGCENEDQKNDNLEDGSSILNFCEDAVGACMDAKCDDQDNGHCA